MGVSLSALLEVDLGLVYILVR